MTRLLLCLLMLGLAACAATPQPAEVLPLAADRPTFIFFYTDG